MVNEFIRFTRSSSYELKHLPESTPLLQKYASNVLKNEPVSLPNMLAFLKALNDADDNDKGISTYFIDFFYEILNKR